MYPNTNNIIIRTCLNIIQHYNHKKYWMMRSEVTNPNSSLPLVIRVFYLFRIKRMDAFNNASMGTNLGFGAVFDTPPYLQHGLNGIIISPFAKLGKNCIINQQVTIAHNDQCLAPTIGDRCIIGAGAKIIGNIKIGDYVKIGANCVVVKDIPDNCTAVGVPARIIFHQEKESKNNFG